MLIKNKQCPNCGSWDVPIGPENIRKEWRDEIDQMFEHLEDFIEEGGNIRFPHPFNRSEFDYIENKLNSYTDSGFRFFTPTKLN